MLTGTLLQRLLGRIGDTCTIIQEFELTLSKLLPQKEQELCKAHLISGQKMFIKLSGGLKWHMEEVVKEKELTLQRIMSSESLSSVHDQLLLETASIHSEASLLTSSVVFEKNDTQTESMEEFRIEEVPKLDIPNDKRVIFHVLQANGLPRVSMFGSTNPYAIILWNQSEIGRTPVLKSVQNPAWNWNVPLERSGGLEYVESVLSLEIYSAANRFLLSCSFTHSFLSFFSLSPSLSHSLTPYPSLTHSLSLTPYLSIIYSENINPSSDIFLGQVTINGMSLAALYTADGLTLPTLPSPYLDKKRQKLVSSKGNIQVVTTYLIPFYYLFHFVYTVLSHVYMKYDIIVFTLSLSLSSFIVLTDRHHYPPHHT